MPSGKEVNLYFFQSVIYPPKAVYSPKKSFHARKKAVILKTELWIVNKITSSKPLLCAPNQERNELSDPTATTMVCDAVMIGQYKILESL